MKKLIQNLNINSIKGIVYNWFDNSNTAFFALEGLLIALINSIIFNNNNLFASRLGASDFQISLVISLPQFVGMLVLIPGGIFTDKLENKRRMVIASLTGLIFVYALIGFVPFLGKNSFWAFLCLIALSAGPMTMYNSSWQAYFSDVTPIQKRNRSLTLRTQGVFFANFLIPFLTGFLLASVASNTLKIRFHQCFFWTACFILAIQILVLSRIKGGVVKRKSEISLKDLKKVFKDLVHNKKFLAFVGIAFFFYMTWQMDWTLYYIVQVKYLKMNEAWLSYVTIGSAAVQFLTIGFWSRVNEKRGIGFPVIIGSLGLAMFPVTEIVSTNVSLASGPVIFLILSSLFNFAFATIMLNIPQLLLEVVPEGNKTLSISIYTVFISLSNAVMPTVGVWIYTGLGATKSAIQITFMIIIALRIIATALWFLRWWIIRKKKVIQ